MPKHKLNVYFLYLAIIGLLIMISIAIFFRPSEPTTIASPIPMLATPSPVPTESQLDPGEDPNYNGVADPITPQEARIEMARGLNLDSLARRGWSANERALIEQEILTQISAKNPGYEFYFLSLVSPDYYYKVQDSAIQIKIGFTPIVTASPTNPNAELEEQEIIPSIFFYANLERTETEVKVLVLDPEISYN